MSGRTYLGFLPWVVFALVAPPMREGVAWGGVAALITAVVITVASARTGSVKLLEVSAIALFAGFVVAGASHQHDPHGLLQQYCLALSAGGLAVIALVSLRSTPVIEPYAREIVPRKLWRTPRFKRVTVDLTLTWAMVFSAIALSNAAAAAIGTRLWETVFNSIVPLALTLVGVKQSSL